MRSCYLCHVLRPLHNCQHTLKMCGVKLLLTPLPTCGQNLLNILCVCLCACSRTNVTIRTTGFVFVFGKPEFSTVLRNSDHSKPCVINADGGFLETWMRIAEKCVGNWKIALVKIELTPLWLKKHQKYMKQRKHKHTDQNPGPDDYGHLRQALHDKSYAAFCQY